MPKMTMRVILKSFEQVAAVVRVFSDEKEVAHDEQGASIL